MSRTVTAENLAPYCPGTFAEAFFNHFIIKLKNKYSAEGMDNEAIVNHIMELLGFVADRPSPIKTYLYGLFYRYDVFCDPKSDNYEEGSSESKIGIPTDELVELFISTYFK